MNKLLCFVNSMLFLWCASTPVADAYAVQNVYPWAVGQVDTSQEKMVEFKHLAEEKGNIQLIRVEIDDLADKEKIGWRLDRVQAAVFIDKLALVAENSTASTNNLQPPQPSKTYAGVVVRMVTYEGQLYVPLRFFQGVVSSNGRQLGYDTNREIEYWLMGTAHIVKQQLKALSVVPVYRYSQCVKMGGQVVESTPRQCLLPNDDTFLEVPEMPAQQDLTITDFEACLERGRAIISAFPRRCVASGGRIFTEKPVLPGQTAPQPEVSQATQSAINQMLQEQKAASATAQQQKTTTENTTKNIVVPAPAQQQSSAESSLEVSTPTADNPAKVITSDDVPDAMQQAPAQLLEAQPKEDISLPPRPSLLPKNVPDKIAPPSLDNTYSQPQSQQKNTGGATTATPPSSAVPH